MLKRSMALPAPGTVLAGWQRWWLLAPVAALLLVQHLVVVSPTTVAHPLTLLARLADLLLIVLALALAGALGARLLRLCGLTLPLAERLPVAVALGVGSAAYACFGLGLVGLYRPPVLLVATGLLALWLRHDLAAIPAWGAGAWRGLRVAGQRVPRAGLAIAPVLALAISIAILGALTPPHHFDPLAYHLAAPQRWLVSGRIAPLPDVPFGNLPATVELVYGVGLAAGSDAFAQMLHLAFGGLTAVALWAAGRRYADDATGWLALAIFLATPLVIVWSRVANVDLPLACFLFLATLAALRAAEPGAAAGRWAVLAGLLAGLALGTKYQALYAAPLLALVLVADLLRQRRGLRVALRLGGLFGAVALLVAAPWYLKNWLLLGNPLWPLFLGGRDFDRQAVELTNYFASGMVLSPRTLTGYLLLPLRAYLRGSIEQPFTVLSPLVLLAPLAVRRAPRLLAYLLIPATGLTIGWALGFQELRYLLPVCAPLSLGAALVLRTAWARPRPRVAVVTALLLVALLTLGTTFLHVGADRPLAVTLGRESRDAYLRASITTGLTYRATQFLVTQVHPGETVRFVNDAQVYYVPFAVEPDHLDLALIALMGAHPEPDAALAALRAEGVDYLLVNEANLRYRRQFDPEDRLGRAHALFARLRPALIELYRDGPAERPSIVIYRVPGETTR